MRTVQLHTAIALRSIFRQPRRSGLTVLAISFSVFCVIVFQALKVGMHQKMIDSALSLDLGTMQIHRVGYEANVALFQTLPEFDSLLKMLKENGLTSYSPRIKAPALILAGQRSSSVLLSGILPEQEKNVTLIHRRLTAGETLPADKDSLLIGRRLADNLKLRVGDDVSLMLQNVFGQPVVKKIKISGMYDTGLSSFDLNHLYLPLPTLQNFLEAGNEVTEIALATDTDKAERLAALLAEKTGPGKYQFTPWQEMAPDIVQLMELNDATFKLLVVIIFLVAAMGIANTMNTVIFERFREFGTIAAIGTTPLQIVSLVSLESFFLGLFACATGTVTALLVCTYLGFHGVDLSHLTSSNQYFTAGAVLTPTVLPGDVASANMITIVTALLAGLYPASKASRLNPVAALNYT
jgi:ABC-type lipoprotein release transport system permease subunit